MKEKLLALKEKFLQAFRKFMYPLLGSISISKEKRVAIEIQQDSISICQFDGKNQIKQFFNERLEVSSGNNIENASEIYEQKIHKIVKKNKLKGYEANLVIPTSYSKIHLINIPVAEEDAASSDDVIFSNFSKNAQTQEFWKSYEQLGEIKETDEVSHFIVSKNDATLELSVIVAITDKEKILSFKNVLKSCGINANLIEPKLFSIINSILIKKQEIKPFQFGILEYTNDKSYFAIVSDTSFKLTEVEISRSDKVLLKQLEKMPSPEGPFWSEVFERSLENVNSSIEEVNNDEDNEIKVKELYFYSEDDKVNNFITGLKNKFQEIIIKEISLVSSNMTEPELEIKDNLVEYDTLKENLLENKIIKLSKKVQKTFPITYININKAFPLIGSSLRYLNAFNVKKKFIPKFQINLNPENFKYLENNKIKTSNYLLNSITVVLLFIFSGLIALNLPVYFEKSKVLKQHPKLVQQYDQKLNEIKNISGKFKKIEADSKLANEVQSANNEYYKLVKNTPSIVPEGVKLNKLEFLDNQAVFEGHAVTDYDLNMFVQNIRDTIGRPDITKLNVAVILNDDAQSAPLEQNESASNNNQQISQNTSSFRNFKIEVDL